MTPSASTFRVGITRDVRTPDGRLVFGDQCLALLDASATIEREYIASSEPKLPAELVARYDALLNFSGNAVTAATLAGAPRVKLVARVGVGYDNVDVNACTRNGVLVTITPQAVRRPVAAGAVAFILALSHRLLEKDALTRSGGWARRNTLIGMGLTGRTLGIVGLGNIGREIVKLMSPFEMRSVAYSPRLTSADAFQAGVTAMPLDELLERADVVCVCCPLTADTRGLIGAPELGKLRRGSYLVNVSRGPVVDQKALIAALETGHLAGAALDVFEEEPISPDHPLLAFDNVLVAPHSVGYTDELFRESIASACRAIIAVASGRIPDQGVLNPEASPTSAAMVHRFTIASDRRDGRRDR